MSEILGRVLHFINEALASTFWFLVVVGVLVFLHELGHFVTAKVFGMRVDTFSLGFGRRLFGRKVGNTDYRISLLPLGGYVNLTGGIEAGETETEGPLPPDYFLTKPRWQRFLVLVMGATVNLVLAFGLFMAAFMLGVEMPVDSPAVIAEVHDGTPAAAAGLTAGDRIVRVDSTEVKTWDEVRTALWRAGNPSIEMAIVRAGEPMNLTFVRTYDERGLPIIGAFVREPAIVSQLDPSMPAAQAGLQNDDRIVAIDGVEVVDFRDVRDLIHASVGRTLALSVDRAGKVFEVAVTPVESTIDDGRVVGRIGFAFKMPTEVVELSFWPAAQRALATCIENTATLFSVLKQLVTRQMPLGTLSGPIEIARMSKAVAARGTAILSWMAFISLQLGILNLLPIPVLDGGHILILLTEGVLRRDLSTTLKGVLMNVGFIIIVGLMLIVIYQDLSRLI